MSQQQDSKFRKEQCAFCQYMPAASTSHWRTITFTSTEDWHILSADA